MLGISNRVLELGIVDNSGNVEWLNDLNFTIQGTHWTTPDLGEAVITIVNIRRDLRDRILSNTIPYLSKNQYTMNVIVKAGRQNHTIGIAYTGTIYRSYQLYKPNIGVQLKCMSGYTNTVQVRKYSGDESTTLKTICQWFAKDHGVNLSFEIEDKPVKSFVYYNPISQQLKAIQELEPTCVAYIDYQLNTLIVRKLDRPHQGANVIDVDVSTGLMQITCTESGVQISMLYSIELNINSIINVKSEINPTLNGKYLVSSIEFSLSSRGDDFNAKINAFRYIN